MWGSRSIYVVIAVLACIVVCEGGVTSSYRRKLAATLDMPLDVDVFKVPDGFNAPQQVHITQGDLDGRGVIISWVTPSRPGSNTVWYGLEKGKYVKSSEGKFLQYKFYNYTSGFIHHCVIKNLEYNTKYYYRLGEGGSAREFWFWTPPSVNPDAAYTFGIIGAVFSLSKLFMDELYQLVALLPLFAPSKLESVFACTSFFWRTYSPLS